MPALSVLITRPQEEAQHLATELPSPWQPIIAPAIVFIPGPDCARLSETTLSAHWVFVSKAAVLYAQQFITLLPSNLILFAVGQATYQALQQWLPNHKIIQPKQQNSEGLLACPALQTQQINTHHIEIFRATSGRELLAEVLQQRGASTQYWAVYERRPNPAFAHLILANPFQSIQCIIITSIDILSLILDFMRQHPTIQQVCFRSTRWLVISQRIACAVENAGIHSHYIHVASGPSNRDILIGLHHIYTEYYHV